MTTGLELKSQQRLVDAWDERAGQDRALSDAHLDALSEVRYAGFLAEYTTHYFGRKDWVLSDGLRIDEFRRWKREHLQRHRVETRVIGSWNYKEKVQQALR